MINDLDAYIEARSCKRLAKLAPHLEAPLTKFYVSRFRSEFRHYQDYLILTETFNRGSNMLLTSRLS
ncbi:MAG: tRNA isopentenyl-2-thiomethyl-A-37 hydroxylase MiaE [Candidatus Phlomobacter fragariae]